MKRLIPFIFVLFCFTQAEAASTRIRAWVIATNNTETGDSFTVNGDIRIWTNSTSSNTISTNAAGTQQGVATNLFDAIAAHPFTTPRVSIQYTNDSSIMFLAPWDQALTVVATGAWATVILSTQSVTETFTAIYPFSGLNTAALRTNQAVEFVKGIETYATNAFNTNSIALSNYFDIGPDTHILTSGKQIHNGIYSNVVVHATDGTFAGGIFDDAVTTNLVNYGNAISSPGSALNSEQFGTGAAASGVNSFAIGNGASATNTGDFAIGLGAVAGGGSSIALGSGPSVLGANSIGIGSSSLTMSATAVGSIGIGYAISPINGTNIISIGGASDVNAFAGIALGYDATVAGTHTNSVALGNRSLTTDTNQVMVGSSLYTVNIPGRLVPSALGITNATMTGRWTNSGSYSTPVTTYSSLADGDNLITLGPEDLYVRLTGANTAAATITGITNTGGMRNGLEVELENGTGYALTLGHNDGAESFPLNRIKSPTAADVTLEDDGTALLKYDSTATRWVIQSVYPTVAISTNAVFATKTNYFHMEEEFFGGGISSTTLGALGWGFSGATMSMIEQDDHPGTLEMTSPSGSGSVGYMYVGPSIVAVSGQIDDIVWDMAWGLKVADISNSTYRFGFIDNINLAAPANMIGFVCTNGASAGSWFGVTRDSSTEAISQSSAVTCDTGWHEFRMKCDGAGTVTFYIDGALIGTDSSNVPTAGMRICLQAVNTDGTTCQIYADWFDLLMTLSR